MDETGWSRFRCPGPGVQLSVVRLVECYNPIRGVSLPSEYYGLTSISDGRVQEAGSTLDLSRGALYPPYLLLLLLHLIES